MAVRRERGGREEEKPQEQPETKKKGSKKKLLLILPAALVVLLLASYFFFPRLLGVFLPAADDEEPEVAETDGPYPYMEALPQFLVNLAEGNRHIKLVLHVGFRERHFLEKMKERNVEIRDRIIVMLRGKTVEEISEPGGAEKLRRNLEHEINAVLGEDAGSVYFWDFLVH